MRINNKPESEKYTTFRGLVLGWLISIMICVLGCCVLAIFIIENVIRWDKVSYGVMVVLLLAAYSGARISTKKTEERRLVICILSGIFFLLTLFCVTALFFGGQYKTISATALLVIGGSCTAALVHCAEKRDRAKVRRKCRL